MLDQLRHAFAVDDDTSPPTPEERRIVERLCREVTRRQLTAPALAFLEMSRPMNRLGAQALHFLNPLISAILPSADVETLARFLERGDAIDLLVQKLEQNEQEAPSREVPRLSSPELPSGG